MSKVISLIKYIYRATMGLFTRRNKPIKSPRNVSIKDDSKTTSVSIKHQAYKGEAMHTPSDTKVENRYNFKLYDTFGSICYDGDNYSEALEKAKVRPYTAFIKAFDEDGNYVAVVWAAPGTGIIPTKISALLPN